MLRPTRHLIALALAAGLLWLAAPALSLDPYVPAAVDFEQPLGQVDRVEASGKAEAGAAEHADEGPVTHRSAPIWAPHRFDFVGLAGEMRPLELRVRAEGEGWSRWVETANGDPVYTGGSEQVQLRTRGWRPQGTLHYVNVSGTTTAAGSLLTGARTAINGGLVTIAGVVEDEAAADVPKPDIVDRGEWGANRDNGGCEPRRRPDYGKVKAGVVHHTVTTNSYSESEAPSIVLGICRYHRNANNWDDIGYNALVDRFGNIYEGRAGGLGRAVVGAQAQGYNAQTAGVASIGTHSSSPISDRAMKGFVHFWSWKLEHHGTRASGHTTLVSAGGDVNKYPKGKRVQVRRLFRHGRVDYTECPGDRLRAQIDEMRHRAQRRIERK